MSDRSEVRLTVLNPTVTGDGAARTGSCALLVASSRPLPRAPYAGTVRVAGVERTATGTHACRMLKRYSVEREADEADGARYLVTVDLGDEDGPAGAAYAAPGYGVRHPDEPIDVVSKRIAGIYGRICEAYRPPSVIVELGD